MEPFEKIYDADYEAGDSDSVRGSDSSDDCLEDFEREMQDALDKRVGLKTPPKHKNRPDDQPACEHEQHADLNSAAGSRLGEGDPAQPNGGSSQKTAEDANDDLFYDPDEDEDNEKWAQRQRQQSIFPASSSARVEPLPRSDAVLNCPGCMTLLCRDCQAHETKSGQYRAMFVLNCKPDTSVQVPGPLTKDRRKRRRGGRDQASESDDKMLFHPFHCNFCQTRIGVFDSDEVYHFLNVLAS
ncbi:E2F-associated phosphoprotein-like [Galendromus occidentalis]|uniref:E2F-associated phosphoprotein-like n=1 Tax=Galendromus occidentalis TaxID=34638 RepID=A0AAJ6QZ50_9ACAR|nr:E2F-associated phosphoprotein-like [Galendromus occidentalis]